MPSSKVFPSGRSGTWVCCHGDSSVLCWLVAFIKGSCIMAVLGAFWCLLWILGGTVQNQWDIKNAFSGSLVLVKGLLCQVTQLLRIDTVRGQAIMSKR